MTTLIGIKAEKGLEGVILASDLSRTRETWSAQGDVAYRQQTKSEGQKIYVDNNREVALCMSGVYDQLYIDFLSRIIEGKIDVKKAVKKGFFPEFKSLNEYRWGARKPDLQNINSLLIATRFNKKPALYGVWPLGRVEEKVWTTIGSGSDYADSYISKQGKLIPRGLSINEGIDIAVSSLNSASQDIYTGGMDLVIITKDKIAEYGKDIKNAIDSSKTKVISKIMHEYKK